eukprot:TRINITY_DN1865_c0_g1_i2.p1 TRINITY_DN1865_c0_g1~~TRINITY_DN1865_c0_g1_i2.p1  ORF type:complete len:159 (+),score=59.57 TRINITY_DN1865_c0_g1_i2:62-538(+)
MNQAKLAKLQKMKGQVRTGGKGSVRRRKKVRRKNAGNDQKKLQMTLKRLGCNYIPNIDEVNLIKDDGHVIQFKNPNVQTAVQSNLFAVQGNAQEKTLQEVLPGILGGNFGSDFGADLGDIDFQNIALGDDDMPELEGADDMPELEEAEDVPALEEVDE